MKFLINFDKEQICSIFLQNKMNDKEWKKNYSTKKVKIIKNSKKCTIPCITLSTVRPYDFI